MDQAEHDLDAKSLLQSIAAFEPLWSESEKLAAVGQIERFAAGTILFSEGDLHDQLYFIGAGNVRLEMATHACGRQTILSVGEGDILAWSSLLGDGVMTTSAITTSDVLTISFDAARLRQVLEEEPSLGYQVLKVVAKALARRLLATRLQLLNLYDH